MGYLDIAARVALGTVFLVAVVGKAGPAAFRAFVMSLDAAGPLARRLDRPTAAAVIGIEALTVVALALPFTVAAGYLLAVAALAVFSTAAAAAMRRGERLRCRCFGADAGPIGRLQLVRNGLLAAAALAALAARLVAGAPSGPGIAGTVLAVAAGLTVGAATVRLDDLVYLFAPPAHRRFT